MFANSRTFASSKERNKTKTSSKVKRKLAEAQNAASGKDNKTIGYRRYKIEDNKKKDGLERLKRKRIRITSIGNSQ